MASKVHRVRYYNPTPQPINCVSLNKTKKHLAVARGDASIEIWDLNYAPYLLKFIPGVENGSVEALCWVNDRLLSTGLGGALIEWDLEKLSLKTTVLLTGYAAWCLDVNSENSVVAVGTEQGYINLYNVENDDIVYKKLFDKQEGRILCCKFNKTGNVLVTGSVDTIRVWNAETGHAITRISVSRRGKETIVWCLAILTDNVIVSGDSYGKLTFWDGTLGSQIESYATHKTDILSIAVSEDERSLYCSGVDPIIMNFIKVNKGQQGEQWVKNVQRHIHEHDVRGLVLNSEQLISVGVDGYLTFSSYPPKWVMRIPPMLPAPRTAVCANKKLLLLRYSNHLEIWKLGSFATANGDVLYNVTSHNQEQKPDAVLEQDTSMPHVEARRQTDTHSLRLTEKPVKLVAVRAKGGKQMRCCEMSPSGEFLVYSTESDVRMLKLDIDDDQTNVSLSKVQISGLPAQCDRLSFSAECGSLVGHSAGQLYVAHVDHAGATVLHTISCHNYFKSKSLLHLIMSKFHSTTYIVAADSLGAITVWASADKRFVHHVTLPKYQCVPSAITVDTRKGTLIIVYVDQKIVVYDLVNKKISPWPGSALPSEWVTRKSAVSSVVPHRTKDALVFTDETGLWVMDTSCGADREPTPKKKANRQVKPGDMNLGLRILPIKYLAGFHWLNGDEAVCVEMLPETIVSLLPPAVAGKRQGRP